MRAVVDNRSYLIFIIFVSMSSLAQQDASHPESETRFQNVKLKKTFKMTNAVVHEEEDEPNNGNLPQFTKIADIMAANRHLALISSSLTCAIPRQKVVRITMCYPYLSGDIYPSSTILHECSDASGCCSAGGHVNSLHDSSSSSSRSKKTFLKKNTLHKKACDDEYMCAAIERQIVTLYFHVYDQGGARQVQELKFFNHTSCSCLPRPPGYSRVNENELLCPWVSDYSDTNDEPRK